MFYKSTTRSFLMLFVFLCMGNYAVASKLDFGTKEEVKKPTKNFNWFEVNHAKQFYAGVGKGVREICFEAGKGNNLFKKSYP